HARAAVIRRAAADSEDEAPVAVVQRCADQFAHAIGGGNTRVALCWRNQRQTCACRHLDSCCTSVAQQSKERLDRLAQWTRYHLSYDVSPVASTSAWTVPSPPSA